MIWYARSRMKLPGGERAVVEIAKLSDYCLNVSHIRGRHKARVFASVLDVASAGAEFVREELLRAARDGDAVTRDSDEYGDRYTVDSELVRGSRRAMVRGTWIVLRDETDPRLTGCYVLLN
jgi:hypothetical protein